jgi:effector-binding domain-containing protein
MALAEHGVEEAMTVTYEIEIREVPARRVATIRERVPMTVIGKEMGEGFGEVARAVQAAGATIDGMPFAIFHEMDVDEVDLELGFPVAGEVGSGRVHGSTQDAGRVATTTHVGPYDEVAPAYEALTAWIDAHGERPGGPPREVYLNEPDEGVVPVTEVQMPLA